MYTPRADLPLFDLLGRDTVFGSPDGFVTKWAVSLPSTPSWGTSAESEN